MRFLTICYDQDEQLAHFDMCNAPNHAKALESAGDLRPDCLPICALTVRELRATATQLNKAKDSKIADARAAIWEETMKGKPKPLTCPQCFGENVELYDGALGYEAVRCNDAECWQETDLNNQNSHCLRQDRPKPEPQSKCDNCEWTGVPTVELDEIPHLAERLEPNGTVPSGECPDCGALCYLVEKP